MIRILRYGNNLYSRRRFYCDACGCIFEADYLDYAANYRDILPNGTIVESNFVCTCPTCGNKAFEDLERRNFNENETLV